VLKTVSAGWPLVLSSLKSYVECGQVLHAPWYEEPHTRPKLGVGAVR
jgi:hypothetical protein